MRSSLLDSAPAIDGGFAVVVGWICLIWYTTVVAVCVLGYYQMFVTTPMARRRRDSILTTFILSDGDTFSRDPDPLALPPMPTPLTLLPFAP